MQYFSARIKILAITLGTILSICGCGGGASSNGGGGGGGGNPVPDFTISDSPGTVSALQGCGTAPITISVAGMNGFTGAVTVTVAGLPDGATTTPSLPLTVGANSSQQLTIMAGTATAPGNYQLLVTGKAGSLVHNAPAITLGTATTPQTSQSGTTLYLESCSSGHLARIGLNKAWGGSIVEVSLDGTNFVNAHDPGREIQPALYDGAAKYDNCAGCTGVWGWNPVQGGDTYGHGSPVLSSQLSPNSIYVKAQPLQWYPDDKGGGPNTPVPSDSYIEETVSVVPSAPLAFKVHYVLTHFGTDQHYNAEQEFPAIYVNSAYGSLVYYGGTAPWTNDATTTISVPLEPGTGTLYTSEDWAANVDANGQGLTVFIPGQLPYGFAVSIPGAGGSGATADATFYQHPSSFFTYGPGAAMKGDVYVIPGAVTDARQIVYGIHQSIPASSTSSALGNVDVPAPNTTVTGKYVTVSGWAFDSDPITNVEVLVDGTAVGTAAYGMPRPDVATVWPNAPVDCGWDFSLDSTTLSNGSHTITITVTDRANNVTVFLPVPITVSN